MPGPQPIQTEGGVDILTESGSQILSEGSPDAPAASVGTQSDMLSRLQQMLPKGWFAVGASPIKDALLTGVANAFAFIYSLFAYVQLQTRVASATDGFLDLIAQDFFGNELPRLPGQLDGSYRARIQANLLLERATRQSIIRVVQQLTGRAPRVFEPQRAADTGGYNTSSMGYGVAGRYGSRAYPYQAFVTAFRPLGIGSGAVSGYGDKLGGYGVGSIAYSSASIRGGVQDSDIVAAIDSVRQCGTILWVAISS